MSNGTTQTNGKYNARAVAAFHLDTARRCHAHCVGSLSGIMYQPQHEKMVMREAISRARLARVRGGIFNAGDYHQPKLV